MRDSELDRLFGRFRRRGDVEALGAAFDQSAPELLRVARHLVGNSAEAEDLVQSTFVTAIEHARDFDDERRLVPWLVGILAHHAANARRKRAGSELEEHSALAPDASKLAEERELRSKLRAIVDELPDVLRAVVAPHLILGLRPQEIAAELGLSPGATRVRLHRGLERVRRALPVGFAAGAVAVSVTSSRGLAAVRSEVLACAHDAAPVLVSSAAPAATSIWLGGSLVLQRIALAAAALAVVAGSIWFLGARSRGSSAVASAGSPPSALGDIASAPLAATSAREDARERELAASELGVVFEGRVVHIVTGEPLAGARVWTTPPDSPSRVQRAVAAEDGTFSFRAAAAEESTLFVEADGYAPARPPLSEKALAAFRDRSKREVLDAGARVRLYELRLSPGVAFEGRVVLAADRSPVPDAELVLAWKQSGVLSTLSEHTVGRTDALGTMRFDGLLPALERANDGTYVLFAVADAGLGWTYIARPGGRTVLTDIEIAIEAPFTLVVDVRDEVGAAVAGAAVRVVPTHQPFAWLPTGQYSESVPASSVLARCFEAVTDEQGVALLRRLPAASESSDGVLRLSSFLVFADTEGGGAARKFCRFGPGGGGSVSLVLARDPATLIRGRVVDVRGAGVEGALVRIAGLGRECQTGADGAYELEKLRTDPVRVNLEASKPGMTIARRMVDRAELGGVVDEQDFVLREPLAIEGRVLDDRGVPLAGLEVHAFGADRQWTHTAEDAPSAADGSFRIEGTSDGEWELYPAASQAPQFEGLVWPSQPVRARGGARGVEIVLERRERASGRLEIEIVDADTGATLDPVYANVFANDGDGPHVEPRCQPGKVVCDEVAPGRYTAWVAVAGRSNGTCEVRLQPGEMLARGRIEIARAARLRGRIDWSRFASPLTADVFARLGTDADVVPANESFARGTAFSTYLRVAAGEEFDFTNLTAGRWSVRLVAEGVRELVLDVELRPGETSDVVLAPHVGGVIEFIASASPGRGWVVFELADEHGEWRESGRDWSGELDPLPPMRVTADPGRVRWRAWFLAENNMLDKQLVAETREGELDLAAGQVARVALAVVRVE